MFVRWKRRKKTLGLWKYDVFRKEPVWVRYLYLCKCIRIDGKPRQQVVAYLGDFAECYTDDNSEDGIKARNRFWWRADQWLEDTDLLSPENTKRLQEQIAKVVPRPDEDELREYKKDTELRLAFFEKHGRPIM